MLANVSNIAESEMLEFLRKEVERLEKENGELKSVRNRIEEALAGERKANRSAKDSVFVKLFEDKENLLEVYRVFHPEDKDSTVDDVERLTLESVLVNQQYNDLGFMVGDKLIILLEAQSYWSWNIVIRMFLYIAWTWMVYIESHKLILVELNIWKIQVLNFNLICIHNT